MSYYRLYLLAEDGRIQRVHETHCDDDDAAIAEASSLEHSHGVAVWQEKRFVGQVEPKTSRLRA